MTWSQVIIGAETAGAVPSDEDHCWRETMVPAHATVCRIWDEREHEGILSSNEIKEIENVSQSCPSVDPQKIKIKKKLHNHVIV